MAFTGFSQLSGLIRSAALQYHWFVLGIGVTASTISAFAIAAYPGSSFFQDQPFAEKEYTHFLRLQPIGAGKSIERPQPARILEGISGEMMRDGENRIAAAQTMLPPRPGENIEPVVWNELSDAANCLTVKTKTGETFSFRVLGLEANKDSGKQQSAGAANLAIAPCANNGAFVEKAVIEPDATSSAAKNPLPARSL